MEPGVQVKEGTLPLGLEKRMQTVVSKRCGEGGRARKWRCLP